MVVFAILPRDVLPLPHWSNACYFEARICEATNAAKIVCASACESMEKRMKANA